MTPDLWCEEKGAPEGSTAYYRRLFLPQPQRQAVTALYAFCHEIGSIADEVSEIEAARIKLGWWHSEIERLYAGMPGHPVTRALQPFIERPGVERRLFEQLLARVGTDLDHAGHDSVEDLLGHARRAAAAQRLESAICGDPGPATRDFAEQLGIALELTRILHDVRADAERGRVYLPAERLAAYGVRRGELVRPATPAHVQALFAAEARRAHEHFERALRALPPAEHRAQRSGLVGAAIGRRLLAEIARDGYRVLEHRIDLTPVRKLWIAWRTARAAGRATARQRKNPA